MRFNVALTEREMERATEERVKLALVCVMYVMYLCGTAYLSASVFVHVP